MSAKTIVFWVAFAAAAGISYFSSVLAGPKANMAVLLMPVMALIWRVYWKEKGTMAVTVVSAAVSLAMWVPLGAASHGIAVAAVILSALVYFLTIPFCIHLDRLNETGDNIKKRREELSRMKNEGINTLNEAYNQADREIKEITSIYTAVKELSATMTLDSSLSTISEILKKVIKSNFKIQIEEISFVIIFKREFDYYVAESYGYDEETIKQAEKQIVASVLRNVSKSQDIVYSRTMEGSGSLSGMSMIKSVVYMPFYAQKKLLGAIFISSTKEGIFSEAHIESLKILSNQIAITMEKVHLYEEVQQMSVTDSLTGLTVHRHFQEKLEMELKRTSRYGGRLSLVMADIDFFKKINDTYGHLAGDFILKTIALILKNHTAQADIVARYGGEEFVIVFPDTDKDAAHMKAVRIRKDVESYKFVFNGQQIKVTMSMGVASYPFDAALRRDLIEKADKALYKAKEEGRNRVIKAG